MAYELCMDWIIIDQPYLFIQMRSVQCILYANTVIFKKKTNILPKSESLRK